MGIPRILIRILYSDKLAPRTNEHIDDNLPLGVRRGSDTILAEGAMPALDEDPFGPELVDGATDELEVLDPPDGPNVVLLVVISTAVLEEDVVDQRLRLGHVGRQDGGQGQQLGTQGPEGVGGQELCACCCDHDLFNPIVSTKGLDGVDGCRMRWDGTTKVP